MFERRSDLVKFLTVVEAERIVTAADRLAMTQPALTRVVARLEKEYEGRLFERIPTGVRLTKLGAVVAERARRILREIEDGEETVVAALAGRTGSFRITAAPVWMQAVLVPAVAAFHAAFPEIELKLRTAAWRDGVRLLADGSADLHVGGIDTGEALPGFPQDGAVGAILMGVVATSAAGAAAIAGEASVIDGIVTFLPASAPLTFAAAAGSDLSWLTPIANLLDKLRRGGIKRQRCRNRRQGR